MVIFPFQQHKYLVKSLKELPERRLGNFTVGRFPNQEIFTHLRVDKDLFEICKLKVSEVFLTQIGKPVPPYEEFEREVKRICPKATLSFDGMKLIL